MALRLESRIVPALPRLAWCATVRPSDDTVSVICGADVHRSDEFVVEGAWDGPFRYGNFPAARHFFGSGVRVEGRDVSCAASTALVDRIVYARSERRISCSNSLPVLLAATACRLDAVHDYTPECRALMAGRHRYRRRFHVLSSHEHHEFGQVFGENLSIREQTVEHVARDAPAVPLKCFSDYAQALGSLVAALVANMSDPARTSPMCRFTTVSTGYDSTAVASLVKTYGVGTCFTTAPGDGREDGLAVAAALGLDAIVLGRAPADHDFELAMLAATLDGREAVFQPMLHHIAGLAGAKAVFTGYHGDKVWDRATHGRHLSADVMRGDTSGLNLAEARLWSGFVNVPLPFAFAAQIADIVAISNSDEMRPWRLGNGYDRLIPRRIAESAGVPRALFGQTKRVVMDYAVMPRNAALRAELESHLAQQYGFGNWSRVLDELTRRIDYACESLSVIGPRRLARVGTNRLLWPAERQLANRIHVWAVNALADQLADAVRD